MINLILGGINIILFLLVPGIAGFINLIVGSGNLWIGFKQQNYITIRKEAIGWSIWIRIVH